MSKSKKPFVPHLYYFSPVITLDILWVVIEIGGLKAQELALLFVLNKAFNEFLRHEDTRKRLINRLSRINNIDKLKAYIESKLNAYPESKLPLANGGDSHYYAYMLYQIQDKIGILTVEKRFKPDLGIQEYLSGNRLGSQPDALYRFRHEPYFDLAKSSHASMLDNKDVEYTCEMPLHFSLLSKCPMHSFDINSLMNCLKAFMEHGCVYGDTIIQETPSGSILDAPFTEYEAKYSGYDYIYAQVADWQLYLNPVPQRCNDGIEFSPDGLMSPLFCITPGSRVVDRTYL